MQKKSTISIIKKIPKTWYFMLASFIPYIYLYFTSTNNLEKVINTFNSLILKILPIFILIFILMALSNYFISTSFIIKHFTGKGIKKWIYTIIGGTLSSGPIYMWYPLLANLKNKGVSNGLIACFLYNRAIKLPLLPLAIMYFGWKYIIILTITMILASILQGIIVDKLLTKQQ